MQDYGKTTYSAAGVYPLQGGVKYASHPQQSYTGSVQYPRVSYVQPMNPAYAQYPQVPYASQSGVTYVNTPSYVQAPSTYGYPSVAQHNINTQYHSQPLPFNQYSPSSFQPVSPIVHATPVASIAPTTAYYQQAAYQPTYHQNPQITKVAVQQQAIYHQQPAFYNHQQPTIYPQQPTIYPQQPNYYHPSSYQPSTYQPNSYQPSIYQPNSYQPNYQPNYQATKQGTPSVAPAPVPAIINSKPIALQAPLASSSSSSVEHGQHSGAVSYSLYSNEPSQNKASLISTQPQQHQLYYQHQQPQQQQQQPIYAYNKQIQYANAQPSYHANSGAVNYGSQLVQQPYAHINKIAYTQASYVQPTAPALIASSSSSTPLQQHKIHYH